MTEYALNLVRVVFYWMKLLLKNAVAWKILGHACVRSRRLIPGVQGNIAFFGVNSFHFDIRP